LFDGTLHGAQLFCIECGFGSENGLRLGKARP
jgi:hypothetical protein